jgi:hypothetical protein
LRHNTGLVIGEAAQRFAAAFERATKLDPTSPEVKRAQMSFYLPARLVTDATAAGTS